MLQVSAYIAVVMWTTVTFLVYHACSNIMQFFITFFSCLPRGGFGHPISEADTVCIPLADGSTTARRTCKLSQNAQAGYDYSLQGPMIYAYLIVDICVPDHRGPGHVRMVSMVNV